MSEACGGVVANTNRCQTKVANVHQISLKGFFKRTVKNRSYKKAECITWAPLCLYKSFLEYTGDSWQSGSVPIFIGAWFNVRLLVFWVKKNYIDWLHKHLPYLTNSTSGLAPTLHILACCLKDMFGRPKSGTVIWLCCHSISTQQRQFGAWN